MASRSSTPNAVRTRRSRRLWLLALLALALFILGARELLAARAELVVRRTQIDATWAELEEEILHRTGVASELLELVEREYPGTPPKDLRVASNSLAGSLGEARVAKKRAAMVEANLSVERAMRRFAGQLRTALGSRWSGEGAQTGLRRVQEAMLASEHRLALRRTAYNEAVQRFNTRLALFPANFAGRLFGMRRYPLYLPTDLQDAVQIPLEPPAELKTGPRTGE
ncbi:MAG: LemA family protein [Bryobacterales bacterium]|nr:LemA family protein [Bryobacterales bacterium]